MLRRNLGKLYSEKLHVFFGENDVTLWHVAFRFLCLKIYTPDWDINPFRVASSSQSLRVTSLAFVHCAELWMDGAALPYTELSRSRDVS